MRSFFYPSILSTVLFVNFALAQVAIHSHYSAGVAAPYSVLGASVDGGEDINFDGYQDYIVGDPGAIVAVGTGTLWGQATLYSGQNGSILATFLSPFSQSTGYASLVRLIPDISGDLIPDVVVGAPFSFGGQGAVYIYSGATFAVYATFIGTNSVSNLGETAESIDDVDLDGMKDLVICSKGDAFTVLGYCLKIISSNINTPVLLSTAVPLTLHGVGATALADYDGDGVGDIGIISTGIFFTSDSAQILSGATNAVLFSYSAPAQSLFTQIFEYPDQDNDGKNEILLSGLPGFALVSTATFSGSLISSSATTVSFSGLAVSDVIQDRTGDNNPEVLLIRTLAPYPANPTVEVADIIQGTILVSYQSPISSMFGVLPPNPRQIKASEIGDLNGDGKNEILVGHPNSILGSSGSSGIVSGAFVVSLDDLTTAGSGCSSTSTGFGPTLTATGSTAVGSPITLSISGALPFASGFLFVAPVLPLPIYLSTNVCDIGLDINYILFMLPIQTDSLGNWQMTIPVPAGLSGISIAAQAGIGFTTSPIGTDLTQALYMHFD